MPSHDRLRRRGAREGSEPVAEPPTRQPAAAEILALQQSAGNQAVIQRLMHNQADNKLSVPPAYADQRIGWDEKAKHVVRSTATPTDPKLVELVKSSPTVKGHAVDGVGLAFGEMTRDANIKATAATLAADWAEPGTADALGEIAEDTYQVLRGFKGEKYGSAEEAKVAWAQSPTDYLPGKPDLPAAGKSVKAAIPKHPESKTYWQYMCVLIALVKAEGLASVLTITKTKGAAPATLEAAIQTLHDYYMRKQQPIQYDDSSARATVMKEWGYTRIYSGLTAWEDLPKKTSLKAGTYIFDITGHTVLVKVKEDFERSADALADPTTVFEPDSDPGNYKPGTEFKKPVTGIYKK